MKGIIYNNVSLVDNSKKIKLTTYYKNNNKKIKKKKKKKNTQDQMKTL